MFSELLDTLQTCKDFKSFESFQVYYGSILSMEIDATFSYDMSEVDPVLLKMRPPQPPDFLEPQLNR